MAIIAIPPFGFFLRQRSVVNDKGSKNREEWFAKELTLSSNRLERFGYFQYNVLPFLDHFVNSGYCLTTVDVAISALDAYKQQLYRDLYVRFFQRYVMNDSRLALPDVDFDGTHKSMIRIMNVDELNLLLIMKPFMLKGCVNCPAITAVIHAAFFNLEELDVRSLNAILYASDESSKLRLMELLGEAETQRKSNAAKRTILVEAAARWNGIHVPNPTLLVAEVAVADELASLRARLAEAECELAATQHALIESAAVADVELHAAEEATRHAQDMLAVVTEELEATKSELAIVEEEHASVLAELGEKSEEILALNAELSNADDELLQSQSDSASYFNALADMQEWVQLFPQQPQFYCAPVDCCIGVPVS